MSTMSNNNVCKYCGQAVIIDAEGLTNDEAIEKATLNCSCEEAKAYKHRNNTLVAAKETIEKTFGDFADGVVNLINAAGVMVYDGGLKSCTVQLSSKVKAHITRMDTKGKRSIKIDRTNKDVISREV